MINIRASSALFLVGCVFFFVHFVKSFSYYVYHFESMFHRFYLPRIEAVQMKNLVHLKFYCCSCRLVQFNISDIFFLRIPSKLRNLGELFVCVLCYVQIQVYALIDIWIWFKIFRTWFEFFTIVSMLVTPFSKHHLKRERY